MLKDTERFHIRKFQIEDAQQMYEIAKDKDVGYNCGWKAHDNVEESRMILDKFLINDNTWAIVDKQTDTLLGLISLNQDRRRQRVGYQELGYWLGKPYWGKGVMVEVAKEILRYGFEDLDLKMISVSYFPFNIQSKRVIEKLGFVYEGCIREVYAHYSNALFDEVIYSLKKAEWKQNN